MFEPEYGKPLNDNNDNNDNNDDKSLMLLHTKNPPGFLPEGFSMRYD